MGRFSLISFAGNMFVAAGVWSCDLMWIFGFFGFFGFLGVFGGGGGVHVVQVT